MYLDKLKVKNFRSIKDLEIDLKNRITILIGINEAGKSNILRALSFLDNRIKPNINDKRDMHADESYDELGYLRFIFIKNADDKVRTSDKLKKLFLNYSGEKIIVDQKKRLSLDEFVEEHDEVLYRVDLDSLTKGYTNWAIENMSFVNDVYKIKDNSGQVVNYNSKNHNLNNYKYYVKDENIEIPEDVLTETTFNDFIDDFYNINLELIEEDFPECIFWRYNDNGNYLPPNIDIQNFLINNESCIPLRNMFNLAGIDDISSAYELAQKKQNGVANLLRTISNKSTDYLHSTWKEQAHLRISLTENGTDINISIEDTVNLYDFSRRSDGFRRFVSFLLMIAARNFTRSIKNTFILIDEPDVGLHPSSSIQLREELISVSKTNFVFYSTHSIFMINKENIDSHIIVKKNNEITEIESPNNSDIYEEEILYNALGYSVFETINKNNIIFEGWRDKRLFNLFLEKEEVDFKNIGSCHSQGVKDIQRVVSMLQLANKEYIIISDSDKPAKDARKRFYEKAKWFLYSDLADESIKTCEDFIKQDVNISVFNIVCMEREIAIFDRSLNNCSGIMDNFDKYLGEQNINQKDRKEILNQYKELLFSSIKIEDVNDIYFKMLNMAKEKFKK